MTFHSEKMYIATSKIGDNHLNMADTQQYMETKTVNMLLGQYKMYVEQVFDLYWFAYKKYRDEGDNPIITKPFQLLKYNIWYLIFDQNKDKPKLVGFTLARSKKIGNKVALLGALPEITGASRSVLTMLVNTLSKPDGSFFGEISHDVENKIKEDVVWVYFHNAEMVMSQLGKEIKPIEGDRYRYTRYIKNVGTSEKLMVGHPSTSTLHNIPTIS